MPGPALGWSVKFKGKDWYALGPDEVRRSKNVHYPAVAGNLIRAAYGAIGKGPLPERIKAAGGVDVARAWAYRVRHGSHGWLIHGRSVRDAAEKIAASMPALSVEDLEAERIDPYWLFLAMPEDLLRVMGRALWGNEIVRDRSVSRLDKPFGRGRHLPLACSLRLAMELDWWASGSNEKREVHKVERAMAVHGGTVPRALVQECVEAGLRIPVRLSDTQRTALRALAREYGGFDDVLALTDAVLLGLWEHGPDYEPPVNDELGPGY